MHRILLIIVLNLICKCVSAQNNAQTIDFVKQVIIEKDSTFYFDRLENVTLKELKKVLQRDTLVDAGYFLAPTNPPATLILKNSERLLIQRKLKEMEEFFWKPRLFEKSALLSANQFIQSNSIERNKIEYRYKKMYSFSKPIFLRHNTICIFYNSYFCGMECGEGNFFVYLKENGKWKRWIFLYGWQS